MNSFIQASNIPCCVSSPRRLNQRKHTTTTPTKTTVIAHTNI